MRQIMSESDRETERGKDRERERERERERMRDSDSDSQSQRMRAGESGRVIDPSEKQCISLPQRLPNCSPLVFIRYKSLAIMLSGYGNILFISNSGQG